MGYEKVYWRDGKAYVKTVTVEYDEKQKKVIETFGEEEVTDKLGRDKCSLGLVCGFDRSKYPKCLEWCPQAKKDNNN